MGRGRRQKRVPPSPTAVHTYKDSRTYGKQNGTYDTSDPQLSRLAEGGWVRREHERSERGESARVWSADRRPPTFHLLAPDSPSNRANWGGARAGSILKYYVVDNKAVPD